MGQDNLFLKICLTVIIDTCLIIISNGQSIILRPGIGIRYFSTKANLSLPNYFDPFFIGKGKFSEPTANVSLELLYKKYSYEVVFTSQQNSNSFYTDFKSARISLLHLEKGGISQFQILRNQFYVLPVKWGKGISPYFGIGFGVGINRPNIFYDSAYYKSRHYSIESPNDYIDFLLTYKSLSRLSYSTVFKVGFAYKIKNVERARLQATYNLGLNKIIQSNYVYYHTLQKYYFSSTSRGSQFSWVHLKLSFLC